jgi:hypothetical protein
MTKPITDEAKIALEYPDKLYVGTFERTSRLEAHLDPTGIALILEPPGADDAHKSIHMHSNFGLIADIPSEIQSRLRRPRPCTHAGGCHLSAERGAATRSFRMLGDRGPFAFCGAVSCPANARATTGFMLSTIDVGIRIVAPRSLVVS